jgi:putative oxidoreductase
MNLPGVLLRFLPVLSFAARMLMGGLFVFAGAIKLRDPSAFAVEIDHYELWPELAPYLAVTLPVIEIVLGLALWGLPRPWRQAAALGCGLLMSAFTFAAASALARGLDVNCGCFGSGSGPITWLTLVRDGLLLGACVLLVWDPLAVTTHAQQRDN